MSEEKQTSVEIGKDVSGRGIVSDNNNIININSINLLSPKEKEKKRNPPCSYPKMCDRDNPTTTFTILSA